MLFRSTALAFSAHHTAAGAGVGGTHGSSMAARTWGQGNVYQWPCHYELGQLYFWGRAVGSYVTLQLLLLLCFPSSPLTCPRWQCMQLPALPGGHLLQPPFTPLSQQSPTTNHPRCHHAEVLPHLATLHNAWSHRGAIYPVRRIAQTKNWPSSSLPQSSTIWLQWPGGIFVCTSLFQDNLEGCTSP